MFFTSNLKSLALSSLVLAALPAVRSVTHNVTVGGTGANALLFDPQSVTAQPGDVVRFIFKQKNHTATQSSFANPCVKQSGGFDTGFIPVAATVTDGFPIAELSVGATDPVWVYCAQGTHCSSGGMVFAINPGSDEKMAAFKAAATGGVASTPVPTSTSTSGTVSAPTPSSTSTTGGTDHKILVGSSGLTFSPANISAQVGDTITFEFRAKNHTVTASSFAAPCVPLSQSSALDAFFDSGFQPVATGATTFPSFTIKVNDTKPIWAYCKQANHCGSGMVFSANADESGARNFAAFQDLAKQLNGTGATTGGNTTGSTTDSNSALQQAIPLRSAGAAIAALVVSAFLL
jgi:plastocyanin